MSFDVETLLEPSRCAVVTSEVQNGILGPAALFPELAEAARPAIGAMVRLVDAARAAGVPVVHCTVRRRADALGANRNARLFGAAIKSARRDGAQDLIPGSSAAGIIDEIGLRATDIELPRLHGLGPMYDSGLGAVLRNLGARTLIPIGVSVNVAILNLVMDAVNSGFDVVLPRDAVAGVPSAYAEAVIDHTIAVLATVTTSAAIARVWRVGCGLPMPIPMA
jgi:nicotinamidase-related amidase